MQAFYNNLESLYNKYQYQPSQIWNVDEFGANANKNGIGRVFVQKGTRNMHSMIPNEREWLSIKLTTINTNKDIIPNYYIFKGIRPRNDYLALYENSAILGMQKNNGWMLINSPNGWIILRERGVLTSIDRHFTTKKHDLLRHCPK